MYIYVKTLKSGQMKTIKFTDFRKQASGLITEIEQGETFLVIRHGKPVAEISTVSKTPGELPAWKEPVTPPEIDGSNLSGAILEEREAGL